MSNTPTLNETLKLLTKGGPHHPKLVDAIYEVYDLVDSLQQQMAERDRTIARLRNSLEESRERCAGRGVKTTMLNRQNRKMRNLLRDIRSEGVGDKFASKIDITLGE